MTSVIARRFASSVARGVSSTSSSPSVRASSRNAAMNWSVYSRSGMPALWAPAMVRSSTSVKFITCRMAYPQWYFSARRSTSRQTKVRKFPMWPRL